MFEYVEKDHRRPDFVEGTPVKLADGQEWILPRPWVRMYPVVAEDGSVQVGGGITFGPEDDELVDQLFLADTLLAKATAEFAMAVRLLRRNYDLPAEAYSKLLVFDSASQDNADVWEGIRGHLRGDSAKLSPVG